MEPELQALSTVARFKYKSANKLGAICRFLGSGLDSDGHFSTSRRFRRSREATRKSLSSCFTMHEKRKKREYLARLRNVEHADFTPLI